MESRFIEAYEDHFPDFEEWLDALSDDRIQLAQMRIERECDADGILSDEGRSHVEADILGSMYVRDLMQFWIELGFAERSIDENGIENFHAIG